MRKISGFYLIALAGCVFIAACSNNEKSSTITPQISEAPALTPPIRYHKLVEVSPGQDYDVLSWGRGQTKTGSFVILHSDSAAAKYTTTSSDLEGEIVDVYNSDMDLDGNPEILVQVKINDTINYTNIYAFEFTNGKAQKLDFPKLSKTQKQGYRGEDNFYTKQGVLMREFPIYSSNSKDAKATGQKRLFEYGLRDNSFTIKQVSKDSTSVNGVKPAAVVPVKSVTTNKPKKSKKHTQEVTHKKKKRKKHHHSEE